MGNNFLPREWNKAYHAYIVSGVQIDKVWLELENNLSFKRKANPDAYSRKHEVFGIDEARELSGWAILKPLTGERKAAVISAGSFTVEAQNALLKLFEDPPSNTYFFIIVPNSAIVLPTLLSRVREVSVRENDDPDKKIESFMESSLPTRLRIISSIIKSKEKEKARNLIKLLEWKVSKMKKSDEKKRLIDIVLRAQKYVEARGASLKVILEYLAVSL